MVRSRWRPKLLSFVVAALVCGGAALELGAQQPPKPSGRVALGGGSGSPGDSLVVPVYFTPPEETQIGHLKIAINFVSANLKFKKVGKGIAAEMNDVDVTSDEKTDKNDKGVEVSTVTVTASVPPGDGSKKGIAGGLLAYLTMDISKTARPAIITLRTSAEATETGTSKKLGPVETADAKIVVITAEDKPLTDCFFFSH